MQLDLSESMEKHLTSEAPETIFEPPRQRKATVFAAFASSRDEKMSLVMGDDDSVFPRFCSFYSVAMDTFGTVGKFSIDDMVAMVIGGLPITNECDKWITEKKGKAKKADDSKAAAASHAAASPAKKDDEVFAWTSLADLVGHFRVRYSRAAWLPPAVS
jgi:hypothetical protein